LGSIESMGSSDLMSFSIPNTPLGQSDISLGDLGNAHNKTIKRSNVAESTEDSREETAPRIKGRLGTKRWGNDTMRTKKDVADEEWVNSVVNDAPTKPVKQTTVFGDAAIEAAIAAATKPALSVEIPSARDPQPPSTSSPLANKDSRVWPGLSIPYPTEEEGDTRRIEGTGRNNKRSRPSTRDSMGSASRLSLNNSIADLSIERMSLTNSVKSLSLEDSDWDLLASINKRMNGDGSNGGMKENAVIVDPVAFNARVNSGMQMSELMKVGWELRPEALGVESVGGGGERSSGRRSGTSSRAGSAESSNSFGLSLGLTGVIKSKTKNGKKTEPEIVRSPKKALTIDGAYLDNLPSLPRKPTKPSTVKKTTTHRGRKVKRTESPVKKAKRGNENGGRHYINVFDNFTHTF